MAHRGLPNGQICLTLSLFPFPNSSRCSSVHCRHGRRRPSSSSFSTVFPSLSLLQPLLFSLSSLLTALHCFSLFSLLLHGLPRSTTSCHHRATSVIQRRSKGAEMVIYSSLTVVTLALAHGCACSGDHGSSEGHWSSVSFGSQLWYQNAQHTLLFKMVPSVPDESAWIVGTLFHAKIETLQVDLSQQEPYFEVAIPNSYS